MPSTFFHNKHCRHAHPITTVCARIGQKISLQYIHFGVFIFISKKSSWDLMVLLSHYFPVYLATLLYSLLTEACVLCYQPVWHNGFHLVFLF